MISTIYMDIIKAAATYNIQNPSMKKLKIRFQDLLLRYK